jgi:hypothetical protein
MAIENESEIHSRYMLGVDRRECRSLRSTFGRAFVVVTLLGLLGACGGGGGSKGPSLSLTPVTTKISADASTSSAPGFVIDVTIVNPPPESDAIYFAAKTTTQGIYVSSLFVFSSTNRASVNVYMRDSSVIGPGKYNDTITVILCTDNQCAHQLTSASATVEYTVTGVAPPRPAAILSTTAIDAQALVIGFAPKIRIGLTFENIDYGNVTEKETTHSTNAIDSVSMYPAPNNAGYLLVQLRDPQSLGTGVYNDTITFRACDITTNSCQGKLLGTPQTITIRYVVGDSITGPRGYTVKAVAASANTIAWDPVHARIYYSGIDANSKEGVVGALDPATQTLGPFARFSSETTSTAVSDDGSFLYVGVNNEGVIARVNLPELSPDITIPLVADPYGGPVRAPQMQVAPGRPRTVAVPVSGPGSNCIALTVFDDAIARPPLFALGGGPCSDYVQWGADNSELYANHIVSDAPDLYTFAVDANGLRLLHREPGPLRLHGGPILYDAGKIYFSSGGVYDTAAQATVGTLTLPSTGAAFVLPDSAHNRIFVVQETDFKTTAIFAYDMATLEKTDSISLYDVPRVGTQRSSPNVILWGRNGIAFPTSDGRIILIHGPFVGQ